MIESLQRYELLIENANKHGVAHNNVLIQTIELLAAFDVPKTMLPVISCTVMDDFRTIPKTTTQ